MIISPITALVIAPVAAAVLLLSPEATIYKYPCNTIITKNTIPSNPNIHRIIKATYPIKVPEVLRPELAPPKAPRPSCSGVEEVAPVHVGAVVPDSDPGVFVVGVLGDDVPVAGF
jgi:hypothetical protein